jgi:hypothetical protein
MPSIDWQNDIWEKQDERAEAGFDELDDETYVALDAVHEYYGLDEPGHIPDMCPPSYPEDSVFTIGEYLSKTCGAEEIYQHLRDMGATSIPSTKHDAVTQLVILCCDEMMWSTSIHDIEHVAKLLMYLSPEELKEKAEAAGISSCGSAADVVARILQDIFADCTIPIKRDDCMVPLLLLRCLVQQNRATVHAELPDTALTKTKIETLWPRLREEWSGLYMRYQMTLVLACSLGITYNDYHEHWHRYIAFLMIICISAIYFLILFATRPTPKSVAAAWACNMDACPEPVFRLVLSYL